MFAGGRMWQLSKQTPFLLQCVGQTLALVQYVLMNWTTFVRSFQVGRFAACDPGSVSQFVSNKKANLLWY